MFDEQADVVTRDARARTERSGALAPWLLKYETANVVTRATRRGRITAADAQVLFGLVDELPITYDAEGLDLTFDNAALLAIDLDLTAYDAVFLELAIRAGLPLATRDRALAAGARTMGVEVLGAA